MATPYDKLAVRYETTLTIAAINQWLRAGTVRIFVCQAVIAFSFR